MVRKAAQCSANDTLMRGEVKSQLKGWRGMNEGQDTVMEMKSKIAAPGAVRVTAVLEKTTGRSVSLGGETYPDRSGMSDSQVRQSSKLRVESRERRGLDSAPITCRQDTKGAL